MSAVETGTDDLAAFRRPPAQVMRLERLGSSHPTRLSFLRTLLRRVEREGWRFDRPVWDVDERGVGHAVYRVRCGPHDRTYSLVAFAHDLPPAMRSDRVIATAWDATFTLFDGELAKGDIARLAANVPLQEAGRVSRRELTLSRANRSGRLFDHVVERLAQGLQPDAETLASVGYLMRTTAVYGSGKFGAADRSAIADREEMAAPFQAEMLTVWLIRAFTVDIVEHLARCRGGERAVPLDRTLRRSLGVGNSTGLGMAPFLAKHPILIHAWMAAREEALARVRALPAAAGPDVTAFEDALRAARENAAAWRSEHRVQMPKLEALRGDLARLRTRAQTFDWNGPHPWDVLWRWGTEHLTPEGQEALLALLLEPHGPLVDGLAERMGADEDFSLDGAMRVADLRRALRDRYDWALRLDRDDPASSARFWYVSEEKLEPRLGERALEPGADREQPLDIARQVALLDAALDGRDAGEPVAALLLERPDLRFTVRRVQTVMRHPYGEIHDNLVAAEMLPIDLLRCKLAYLGASRFDPRSDRWVRISLFQDMPFPDEIAASAFS